MMLESLQDATADLNENEALRLVNEKIQVGEDPKGIVEALSRGMETVTERFEKAEYGLAELHMATEIFNECVKLVEPKLRESPKLGRIVIGQVTGRLEDFSREPIAGMLKATGFEVHDLGGDVPGERFVEKAREVEADVIGICGIQATAVDAARDIVSKVRASGIGAKILIGAGMSCGCQIVVDDEMRRMVGADGIWNGVREAVDLAKKMMVKDA